MHTLTRSSHVQASQKLVTHTFGFAVLCSRFRDDYTSKIRAQRRAETSSDTRPAVGRSRVEAWRTRRGLLLHSIVVCVCVCVRAFANVCLPKQNEAWNSQMVEPRSLLQAFTFSAPCAYFSKTRFLVAKYLQNRLLLICPGTASCCLFACSPAPWKRRRN